MTTESIIRPQSGDPVSFVVASIAKGQTGWFQNFTIMIETQKVFNKENGKISLLQLLQLCTHCSLILSKGVTAWHLGKLQTYWGGVVLVSDRHLCPARSYYYIRFYSLQPGRQSSIVISIVKRIWKHFKIIIETQKSFNWGKRKKLTIMAVMYPLLANIKTEQ